jgi:ribosome biogenesis GTPase
MDNKEIVCKLAGFVIKADGVLPAVGDFVTLDENGYIADILPHKNTIARQGAGSKMVNEQVLATNIDNAFIVTSLNNDFNPRRIERYIAFLEMQDIDCRLILTKADLCDDINHYLARAQNMGPEIIVTSTVDGRGLDEITNLLSPDITAVFIGSSGVGKSSIINYLVGQDVQKVKEVRAADNKGKHTTTRRELFMLKNGACIIDTPGMREIQFWVGNGDITSFGDIETLSRSCKFRDCKHETEPGCAVKEAIRRGKLAPERLKSHKKLEREAKAAKMRNFLKEKNQNKKVFKRG